MMNQGLRCSSARMAERSSTRIGWPDATVRTALPGMLERANGTVVNVAGMIAFAGPAPESQLPRRAVYAGTLAHIVGIERGNRSP